MNAISCWDYYCLQNIVPLTVMLTLHQTYIGRHYPHFTKEETEAGSLGYVLVMFLIAHLSVYPLIN